MNPTIQQSLTTVVEVFAKKCQQLANHRNPNIYLKSNKELFSDWFEDGLENYHILKLGENSHPDLIVAGVGFELKSLRTNGQIQFNSTIPCGGFEHGTHSGECYYAVARYRVDRNYGYLKDFTICDGDFFNHNRKLAFSHANKQDTGFGDYGDGVVRYRKMYNFPSPLRSVPGISLISKYPDLASYDPNLTLEKDIVRTDTNGQSFTFFVYRHSLIKD